MQAADFIRKWSPGSPAHELNERAGAQAHFIDLCRVLGVPEPGLRRGMKPLNRYVATVRVAKHPLFLSGCRCKPDPVRGGMSSRDRTTPRSKVVR